MYNCRVTLNKIKINQKKKKNEFQGSKKKEVDIKKTDIKEVDVMGMDIKKVHADTPVILINYSSIIVSYMIKRSKKQSMRVRIMKFNSQL